jgi:hypothetical protein
MLRRRLQQSLTLLAARQECLVVAAACRLLLLRRRPRHDTDGSRGGRGAKTFKIIMDFLPSNTAVSNEALIEVLRTVCAVQNITSSSLL